MLSLGRLQRGPGEAERPLQEAVKDVEKEEKEKSLEYLTRVATNSDSRDFPFYIENSYGFYFLTPRHGFVDTLLMFSFQSNL